MSQRETLVVALSQSQGRVSPLWGSRAIRCSVLGLLGSGVSSWVDLFGAVMRPPHWGILQIRCRKENDLGVRTASKRIQVLTGKRTLPGATPEATYSNHKEQCGHHLRSHIQTEDEVHAIQLHGEFFF